MLIDAQFYTSSLLHFILYFSQRKDPGQEDQRAHWACEALKEQRQLPAARQSERGQETGGQAERHLGGTETPGMHWPIMTLTLTWQIIAIVVVNKVVLTSFFNSESCFFFFLVSFTTNNLKQFMLKITQISCAPFSIWVTFSFVSTACTSQWSSLCQHKEKWASAPGAHPLRIHGIKCPIKQRNLYTTWLSLLFYFIFVWAVTRWWFASFDYKWNHCYFISPASWEWPAEVA